MNKVTKVLSISFVINGLLSLTKIIFGILGKSSALIADGIHSLSDLITDVIAVGGSILSNRPADLKHPYGHGKLEYIISIIIGLVVLFLGFSIIFKSSNNDIVIPSFIVIFVSVITIILKLILANFILKKGKLYNSNILISSGLESKADVISSLVVLISIGLMQLSPIISIFKYSDMIASIIIGILIIKVAFSILKDNLSMILGEQENNIEYINKIKKIILNDKNVKSIDSMVLLKYGSYYKLTFEVSMEGSISLLESHNIIHQIEDNIRNNNQEIVYINSHINPYEFKKI